MMHRKKITQEFMILPKGGLLRFSLCEFLPEICANGLNFTGCKQICCIVHNRNAITLVFSVALFSE